MHLVTRGRTELALPHLRTIVDAVLAGNDDFKVSGLADAIMWGRRSTRGSDAEASENDHARETNDALSAMLGRLWNAAFPVRLKLWTGGWLLDLDNQAAPRAAADAAIAGLAREVCQMPELLTDGLIGWLSLHAEQGGSFWFQIGLSDIAGIFQQRARQFSSSDASQHGFILYMLGWAARDIEAARRFFNEVADAGGTSPRAVLAGALEIDPPERGTERIVDLLSSHQIDGERISNRELVSATWLRQVSDAGLVRVFRLIAGDDFAGGSQLPHLVFLRMHNRPLTSGPLVDFCWEYLEAHQPLNARQDDYYNDDLAGRLARLDPDRAFALLGTAILDERAGSRWNPLSSSQLSFWRELGGLDRARAIATVLDASRTPGMARHTIGWYLPNLVDVPADGDVLAQYADRGEAEALTVVQAITGGQPGFWPLAFKLVNAHPDNVRIRCDLELRVEQIGQTISGPYSEHYERCREDVEQALSLPEVTEPVRSWLTDFEQRLARAAAEQRRQEADDRINSG